MIKTPPLMPMTAAVASKRATKAVPSKNGATKRAPSKKKPLTTHRRFTLNGWWGYWRLSLLALFLIGFVGAVVWKIAGLQVRAEIHHGADFLKTQGSLRTHRVEKLPAYRGVISDRNGRALAVSTPLMRIWVDPKIVHEYPEEWSSLAKATGIPLSEFKQRLHNYRNKQFMSLRYWPPQKADQLLAQKFHGVYAQESYRRYYPCAEACAHVIGFTDSDDNGQEGVELMLDAHLAGEMGEKHVLKNRKGQVIRDLGLIKAAKPGKSIQLSLDLGVQYQAYRALKQAVSEHQASSGSIVVVDVPTGEILAMANQPSYNPNDRSDRQSYRVRNRALVDTYEPGSTIKPFSILAAMEQGIVTPNTQIDTSPGWIHIVSKTFKDPTNRGVLTTAGILKKSSQVGTVKIALDTPSEQVYHLYQRVGFGLPLGLGFPGERSGRVPLVHKKDKVSRANLAFGYGLTVNTAQLAQAYHVLAHRGVKIPLSLLHRSEPLHTSAERVVSEKYADEMLTMLAGVNQPDGTGKLAMMTHYSSAGKSGTAHRVSPKGGYYPDRYRALFAGIAPIEDPKIVVVVKLEDPKSGKYFGGQVAAPVFAEVASRALRLMNTPIRDVAQFRAK